jgi:elongation factor G
MPTERRNIGILAHIDAGKTTLTEQLLYVGGSISRPGAVDHGTTVSDWMVDEQERGITIASAAADFVWRDVSVTLVDTPGHVDFTIEVERALRVLDGVVVIISAPDGVQAQTETVWNQASLHGLPVIFFVNKLDREGVYLEAILEELAETFGVTPVPLHLPERTATGWELREVFPPLQSEIGVPVDRALERAQETWTNAASTHDDRYLELLLEGGALRRDQHIAALRKAVSSRAAVPVVFGIAREGLGVEALADAIIDLLPSPTERVTLTFDRNNLPESLSPEDPPCLYVFKTEPRRRERLAFVRGYNGPIPSFARLFRTHGEPLPPVPFATVSGRDFNEIAFLAPGQIATLVYPSGAPTPRTGETLGLGPPRLTFEPLSPPAPVVQVAVEAPDLASHDAMVRCFQQQSDDDPSLRVSVDPASGRLVLSGMGELHLQVAIQRAERTLGHALRTGKAHVVTRQVLREAGSSEVQVRHPAGHGAVMITVVTRPSAARELVIPPLARVDFREALLSGLESALGIDGSRPHAILGGRVEITSVQLPGHDHVPSMLRDAAEWATLNALSSAGLDLAEPWAHLEIVTPDASVGRVVGDLARRRARLLGSTSKGASQTLKAEAPIAELFGYASDLRSITAGRGTFALEPIGYRVTNASTGPSEL